MNNLIDDPAFQDVVEDLSDRMWTWLEETDGMQIPLRRDQGFRGADRGPKPEDDVSDMMHFGR